MIDYRLKKCCQDCPHIDVKVTHYQRTALGGNPENDIKIFCIHEPVCEKYIREVDSPEVNQYD